MDIISFIRSINRDRKILLELSKKDFQQKYAGSFLGSFWAVATPLLTMIIYTMVFQFGFKSGDVGEIPFSLWFMCGLVPWFLISDAFATGSTSFLEYSYLIKKVVFNINILPLVKIFSSVIAHLFFMIILIGTCFVFGYYPTIYWIQLPYYLLCIVAFTFPLSLLFTSLMVFFRDIGQLINVILLIGMWGTPIAWNLSMFNEQIQSSLKLNPIYYLVEGYRHTFIENKWVWERGYLNFYFWGITIVLMAVSIYIYSGLKSGFADAI